MAALVSVTSTSLVKEADWAALAKAVASIASDYDNDGYAMNASGPGMPARVRSKSGEDFDFIVTGSTFIVPDNMMAIITNAYHHASVTDLLALAADLTTSYTLSSLTSGGETLLCLPLNSGDKITAGSSGINASSSYAGILVPLDQRIEVVFKKVMLTDPYIVPDGKVFLMTNAHAPGTQVNARIVVDGTPGPLFANIGHGTTSSSGGFNQLEGVWFGERQVISSDSDASPLHITGFLL